MGDPDEDTFTAALTRGDEAGIMAAAQGLHRADTAREARLTAVAALKDTAIWYATQGIPVFPCIPGEKRPLTPHGFKDATTDTIQVAAWWDAAPAANIAAPTGIHFDVVDIDSPEGMRELGRRVIDTGGLGPVLGVALTPRGRHYYVPPDPAARNGVRVLPGVDTRATGGYVLLPPSRTPTAHNRWVPGKHLRTGGAG